MPVRSLIAQGRESIQQRLVSLQRADSDRARDIGDLVDRVLAQIAAEEALLDEASIRSNVDVHRHRAANLRVRLVLLRLLTWREDSVRAKRGLGELLDVLSEQGPELLDAGDALDEAARARLSLRIAQIASGPKRYAACDYVRALPLRDEEVDRVA